MLTANMDMILTTYTMDHTSTPGSFHGLFASLLPVKDFGLDKSKLPDCFTYVLMASMGEGEIIGTDVRRLECRCTSAHCTAVT